MFCNYVRASPEVWGIKHACAARTWREGGDGVRLHREGVAGVLLYMSFGVHFTHIWPCGHVETVYLDGEYEEKRHCLWPLSAFAGRRVSELSDRLSLDMCFPVRTESRRGQAERVSRGRSLVPGRSREG